MSYSTQLITEAVLGRHNISDFVREEIASISQDDINLALDRAELFLTRPREDLSSLARIEEITLIYTLEEAKQLLVNALLSSIVLIKPDILIRRGKEEAFAGVAPIQAIATQIGLHLHKDQLDAVQTGIELLAEFTDLGIYDVRIVKEVDRAQNAYSLEVAGDSVVIIPTMEVSLALHLKIRATMYLPPMLVQPIEL